MKKELIALSLTALVSGAVAFGVAKFSTQSGGGSYTAQLEDRNSKDTYFTSTDGALELPDLTQAAQMGVDAVVNIEAIKKSVPQQDAQRVDPFELFFGFPGRSQAPQMQPRDERSGGSGVIISSDGYIVSNNHVVEGATDLEITLHDGSSYKGKVIGTDPATDLSLIKIEVKDKELPILTFGSSEGIKLGEWVLAVGNPYGLTSTVTAGIVSAKGRSLGVIPSQLSIESFIQTDAAVNPGNSGGALVNTRGELIGINTVIKSPTGSFAGYSFAVPSDIVRKIVADIRQYGLVQRAMLGIAGREISEDWLEQFSKDTGITERGGIYIGEVTQGGAAEAAGIKKGDVLFEINAKKISTMAQLQELIAKQRPNDVVKVSIKREGAVKHFDVTLRNRAGKTSLVSKEDVDLIKDLGAKFRPVTEKQIKELKIRGGVQVTAIETGGILAKARVRAGYIITEINEMPINSISDLNKITDKVKYIDGIYPNGQLASYAALVE